MSDPSDPTGALPVNRLLSVSPSLEELVSHAMRTVWTIDMQSAGEQDERHLASELLEQSAGVWKQLDRRELYRAVYALARTEIALGETKKAIRGGFREMAAELEGMADTIALAVEDALSGRAPRW